MISQIIKYITPSMYQTTIDSIKHELNKKINLSLVDVKDEIRQIYAQIKQSKSTTRDIEVILAHITKKWKENCRICGKEGHTGADYWDNERNKSRRLNFTNLQIKE
jgi:hypothetical protein